MIEIIPPLGKYEYDTGRILPVNSYIDNSVRLRSCIRNVKNISGAVVGEKTSIFYLSIDYTG
jgi:hypothetical protein